MGKRSERWGPSEPPLRYGLGSVEAGDLDAGAADRGADGAAGVAAVLLGAADGVAARLAAELLGAAAAKWSADAAAVVAAVFALAADDAVARLPGAERLRARLVQRDAGALAANIAAVGPLDAEDGGARTGARDRDADPGAVGAAGSRVAAVPDVVYACVAVRARNSGDAAAIPAGIVDGADSNVGAGAATTGQTKRGAGQPS